MGRIDRAVGAAAVAVTAIAVSVAIVVAPRETEPSRVDLAVLADLVERLVRGDDATYLVDYETSRVGPDQQVESTSTALRRPEVQAVIAGSTLAATYGDTTVSCTQLEEGPACLEGEAEGSGIPRAAVIAEMIRGGTYSLEATGSQWIADEPAACFEVRLLRDDALDLLGRATLLCLAPDGVPLRWETEHSGVTDARVAATVSRSVDDADVARLLDPFDPELAQD